MLDIDSERTKISKPRNKKENSNEHTRAFCDIVLER